PGTARGARRFLEVSQEILSQPDAALWIAAEGRSTDPRDPPVKLRSGIGHLAPRVAPAVLLPRALEYPFSDGRRPGALARFRGDAGPFRRGDHLRRRRPRRRRLDPHPGALPGVGPRRPGHGGPLPRPRPLRGPARGQRRGGGLKLLAASEGPLSRRPAPGRAGR